MISIKYFIIIIICYNLILSKSSTVVQSAPTIKIDKNTIELLNNGLKALISIKQILSTIQTFNELHTMFKEQKQQQQQQQKNLQNSNNQISLTGIPILLNSSPSSSVDDNQANLLSMQPIPSSSLSSSSSSSLSSSSSAPSNILRNSFVQKLFGKILLPPIINHKGINVNKIAKVQRDPSLGLIKIGEKPPPGLFPETLPYSVSQFDSTNEQSLPSSTSSSINEQDTLKHLSIFNQQQQKQQLKNNQNLNLIDLNYDHNHQLTSTEFDDQKKITETINRFIHNNNNINNLSLTDKNEEIFGYFDHDTLTPYQYFTTSSLPSAIPTKSSLSSSIKTMKIIR